MLLFLLLLLLFISYMIFLFILDSESPIPNHILSGLKEHQISSCTEALKLGSVDALAWVPRLLQLIELYPDVIPLFIEKVGISNAIISDQMG